MVSNTENNLTGRPPRVIPLCQLRAGERGTVRATDLQCEECELLRAMGVNEQAEVRVCRGGDQCIVQVNSTRLGLSLAIAEKVLVSPARTSD